MKAIETVSDDPSGQKRTLVSAAYDDLRRDILLGQLRPGDKLRFNQLADSYRYSVSTLREALSRLVGDGLVVLEEQRGFTVSMVSRAHLNDLLAMRLLLEEQGIRLSIRNGGVDWEVGVMSAFHRLSRIGERDAADPRLLNEEWDALHAAFHRALIAGCGSPLLMQFRDTVFFQGERYRRLYLKYAVAERDHLGEHQRIVDAALRRDEEETVRLVREHLQKTVRDVLATDIALNQSDDAEKTKNDIANGRNYVRDQRGGNETAPGRS